MNQSGHAAGLQKTKNGVEVSVESTAAICYCLLGGVQKCYPKGQRQDAFEIIKTAIYYHPKFDPSKHTFNARPYTPDFNDDPNITFQDILEVVNAADI